MVRGVIGRTSASVDEAQHRAAPTHLRAPTQPGMPGSPGRAARAADEIARLARFTRDLPGFLHRPIGPDEARARLRHGLRTREQRFLRLVGRLIYGYARSPYLPLLQHAGCEQGDVRRLVTQEGVEGALRQLARAGVYVTHEELKGIRDVVRGSLRFRFPDTQFDNPLLPGHLVAETGGSGGTTTRVRRSLRLLDEMAAWVGLAQQAHGLDRPRHAFWMTGPVWWALIYGKLDQPVDGWFHPLEPLHWRVRIGAPYLRLLGRLGGQRWPQPLACDLRSPEPLARWLAERAAESRPLLLTTASSAATRVAIAADAAGLSLVGVTFVVKSEPLTETRRRLIESTGARVLVLYGSMEVPTIGSGCATPAAPDDMHLAADLHAVITRRREAIAGGPEVDALLLSSLSPYAARICLNLELGDYAQVEERDCGCLLGELGLRTHLSEVRGFDKLTGEGVTFVRASLERILENVLPTRFGGTALDYQIVEEEADDGLARLILRVAPSVGVVDEAALRTTLLRELGRGGMIQQYMAALWQRAETITISREPPETTRAGKVLPFRGLKRLAGASRQR
jgi:hypothetical protein